MQVYRHAAIVSLHARTSQPFPDIAVANLPLFGTAAAAAAAAAAVVYDDAGTTMHYSVGQTSPQL